MPLLSAPTQLQVIGNELALKWPSGAESYLPLELLRRACPCAACGGEPDVMGRLLRPQVNYGTQSFLLKNFRLVGGYALQLTWQDGHDTGLYTFPYLQELERRASHAP